MKLISEKEIMTNAELYVQRESIWFLPALYIADITHSDKKKLDA